MTTTADDLNVERWAPFSDKERATIGIAITGTMLVAFGILSEEEAQMPTGASPERQVEILDCAARIGSEIAMSMGEPSIDLVMLEQAKEKILSEGGVNREHFS